MTDTEPKLSEPKTAGVIAPPPLLLLISLIIGFVLSGVAPLGLLEVFPTGVRYSIGGAMIIAALGLSLMAVMKFGAADTPANPYYPPSALVTSGVFATVRNPMYVGFYVFSLGLAIAFAADWLIATTAVLAIIIHKTVVKREERFMEMKFGEEYAAYKARVKRYGLF